MGLKDFFRAIKETYEEVSSTRGYPVYVLKCVIEPSEGLFKLHGRYQMRIYFGMASFTLPDAIEFEYMYVDKDGQIFLEEAFSCSGRNFKADGKEFYVTVPLQREPSLMAASLGQAWPYRVFSKNGLWSNPRYAEDEKRSREKIESLLQKL